MRTFRFAAEKGSLNQSQASSGVAQSCLLLSAVMQGVRYTLSSSSCPDPRCNIDTPDHTLTMLGPYLLRATLMYIILSLKVQETSK